MAGFFNKSVNPGTPPVAPLAQERLTAVLDADGMGYGIDDDGDLGGYWDGHLFYFFLMGEHKEILQIRGRWNRDIPADAYEDMLETANRVHVERMFPRIAVLREEDGTLGVYTQHSVDYEHGVTDEQLRLHTATAIGTSLRFFELLDEQYPEAAAKAKEAFENR